MSPILRIPAAATLLFGSLLAAGTASAADTGMAQEHHHDHAAMAEPSGIPTPEGMSIQIVAPDDGATVSTDAPLTVQVSTQGMDASGDHWHLYVDGELQAMVGGGRTDYALDTSILEAGEHELKVTISNSSHDEYDLAAVRRFRVQASARSSSDSPAE